MALKRGKFQQDCSPEVHFSQGSLGKAHSLGDLISSYSPERQRECVGRGIRGLLSPGKAQLFIISAKRRFFSVCLFGNLYPKSLSPISSFKNNRLPLHGFSFGIMIAYYYYNNNKRKKKKMKKRKNI